jgi:two-component system cell cycle response regulator DivK
MQNSSKVVLVIEDNEQNMILFRDILEARGYNVLQATNGMEGWRSACENHPDLIVMDIQLPDVSGLEIARRLKDHEILRSIPIVAVTAFAMSGNEDKILENGCDAYISMPISVLDFLKTIDLFVTKQGPNQAECDLEAAQSLN